VKNSKPKFPFRVITQWTHPSEVTMCEACKKPGNMYVIENYIAMSMMVGKTAFATLTNDPWVRAIKAQAREQFDVSFTSRVCIDCLSELHIVAYGDSPTWQEALTLLSNNYGKIAIGGFILVNNYEDEGVSHWFLCPVTDSILDVSDYIEHLKVEPHETRPTTHEDIQGVIDEVKRYAQEHGKPIKIIRQDGEPL
jgi:hypothetical protein